MLRWRCGRACAGLAWLLAGLPRAPCAAGADEARRGLRGAGGASAVERACAGLGVPPRESKQYAFYLGLSLARAAELGNAECLRAILALDAPPVDANVADHAGLTALAHAARRGDVAAAALLLPLTDVRCAAWACRAPVALASQEGHADLLELLLDAGAAADGADPEGRPPLHLASLGGHAAAAETLLERGADVHGRVAEDGRTALHRAASRGHAGVVAVLLRAGADPAAPDAWQHTAGHLAGQQGHAQVAATLDSLAQARAGRLGRELEVEKLRLLDMERRLAYERMVPRYRDRAFHFTRIVNTWQYRIRDAAQIGLIEYVDRPGELRPAAPVGAARVQHVAYEFLATRRGRRRHLTELQEHLAKGRGAVALDSGVLERCLFEAQKFEAAGASSPASAATAATVE